MIKDIKKFLRMESCAGVLLAVAAILAMILKNSSVSNLYDAFLAHSLGFHFGSFIFSKTVLHWINDFLMSIFFLLVGLEIKREVLDGKLSTKDQITLPALAALGGIVMPAIIYTYFNFSNSAALKGWAIPAATDIAFAIGVLALLGNRISPNLKICLLAIAIMDDLVAVLIIAIFYTKNISLTWLLISLLPLGILKYLNQCANRNFPSYLIGGIILWICILNSGVHATVAGVLLALFIPLRTPNHYSPLRKLEHALHPWVAYGVLPIFALANAGVSFTGLSLGLLTQPITLGIAAGLFLGKQIGVMLFSFIAIKAKLCKLPKGINWMHYYGMALLTGIGFTMSLFIGMLAFDDTESQIAIRLGVILGSFLSGMAGFIVLKTISKAK